MQYEKKAKELRAEILKMLYACQSGHPGGSLSCVEMLMALYYDVMKIDPKNPKDPNRDRFVLSKGHACPTLYAILADLGYFPKEDLANLRQIDSHLQGHPDCNKTPGVDMNTGSLDRALPWLWAWLWPRSMPERSIMFTLYWATASARRAWFGRQRWRPLITSGQPDLYAGPQRPSDRWKQRSGYGPGRHCEEV